MSIVSKYFRFPRNSCPTTCIAKPLYSFFMITYNRESLQKRETSSKWGNLSSKAHVCDQDIVMMTFYIVCSLRCTSKYCLERLKFINMINIYLQIGLLQSVTLCSVLPLYSSWDFHHFHNTPSPRNSFSDIYLHVLVTFSSSTKDAPNRKGKKGNCNIWKPSYSVTNHTFFNFFCTTGRMVGKRWWGWWWS